MKLIAVLLALLIAALPVPASACAAVAGDGAAVAAGQADDGGGGAGHDCCPGGEDEASDDGAPGCDGSDHCNRCMAPGGVPSAQFALLEVERPQSAFAALAADLFPSHDGPPFRPPIS